jgi:hypothetical protein
LLTMKRIERIRLYPTPHQAAHLAFMLDVTRQLYNALLEQRRDAYRKRGVSLSARQQHKEITALREGDSRIRGVYRECLDAALRASRVATRFTRMSMRRWRSAGGYSWCLRGEARRWPTSEIREVG